MKLFRDLYDSLDVNAPAPWLDIFNLVEDVERAFAALAAEIEQVKARTVAPDVVYKSKEDAIREANRLAHLCDEWYDRWQAAEAEIVRLKAALERSPNR